MKFKIVVMLKALVITAAILIFLILMLVVVNEGEKKINGQGVLISIDCNAVHLKKGLKEYVIEPDRESFREFENFVIKNPGILPAPFSFSLIANSFVSSFL